MAEKISVSNLLIRVKALETGAGTASSAVTAALEAQDVAHRQLIDSKVAGIGISSTNAAVVSNKSLILANTTKITANTAAIEALSIEISDTDYTKRNVDETISGRWKFANPIRANEINEYGTNHGVHIEAVQMRDGAIQETDFVQFDIAYVDGFNEGRLQWNTEDGTLEFGLPGGNVNLQIGQEQLVRCRNTTGVAIPNGSVVYISGATGNKPLIALADADLDATIDVIGFATEDIAHNSNGYVTTFGMVRDVDTSGMTEGDVIYLSSTAGAFTTTRPTPPVHSIHLGHVVAVHASTGIILAVVEEAQEIEYLSDVIIDSIGDDEILQWDTASLVWKNQTLVEANIAPLDEFTTVKEHQALIAPFMDGATVESALIAVTESGGVVSLGLQANPTGDLTFMFSGAHEIYDTTPEVLVALTAGTDPAPQINYVYVTPSPATLVASTVGWPATEHAPIATVLVQSAADVALHGAYKVHAWTDHVNKATENGHLSHINRWIRGRPAGWTSGVAASPLAISSPDASFDVGSGSVFQLHPHSFPAIDMAVDGAYVTNDSVTPFNHIHSFDEINADASGGTINNKWFSIIVWGCVSEQEADCKLFINLPSDTYSTEAQALADSFDYTNYSFHPDFVGTSFLIARYLVRGQTSGAWVEGTGSPFDLRGLFPATTPGGAVGITDHGSLSGLLDDDHTQYHNDTRGDIRYAAISRVVDLEDVALTRVSPGELSTTENITSSGDFEAVDIKATGIIYIGADVSIFRQTTNALKTNDTFQALRVGVGTDPHATYSLHAQKANSIAGLFERTSSVTTGILTTLVVKGHTSANMTTLEPAIQFQVEDSSTVENPIGLITCYRDGADNTGHFRLIPYSAGALDVTFEVWPNNAKVTGLLQVTGETTVAGLSNTATGIYRSVNTGALIMYGGTSGNGANIELYSGAHATLANRAYYDANLHVFRTQPGVGIGTWDASGIWLVSGDSLHVNSISVVGAQQSAIANPASSTGANNTAIISILGAMRNHGLIAT